MRSRAAAPRCIASKPDRRLVQSSIVPERVLERQVLRLMATTSPTGWLRDGLLPAAASVHHAHHMDACIDAMRRGAAARLRMRARGWCAWLCAAAARLAPRAEKQLAPQFYLVQFTRFYKYLKLFISHTCALDPIRPESAIKKNMVSRNY
jgi:hypothetical protein